MTALGRLQTAREASVASSALHVSHQLTMSDYERHAASARSLGERLMRSLRLQSRRALLLAPHRRSKSAGSIDLI